MPPRRKRAEDEGAALQEACRDRLSALPDDVLHHLLSLLPAQQAVRTCVLAQRWRHLWRSATGLRILCDGKNEPACVKEIREFVGNLLRVRGDSPLVECELDLQGFGVEDVTDNEDEDEDGSSHLTWIDRLIQRVLEWKVQVLTINIRQSSHHHFLCHQLDNRLLVSQHLKRLHLSHIYLELRLLDFSSCPALEVLEFSQCGYISVGRIISPSIKSLSFYDVCAFGEDLRSHICASNLFSLLLEVTYGRTPVLDRMPSLMVAVVKIEPPGFIDNTGFDFCEYSDSGDCGDEDCPFDCGVEGDVNGCVLLQGLSEAQSLVLISDIRMFIFRRDLKCCPIFSNLKTLVLNEYWCVSSDDDFIDDFTDDLSSLTCIMEHSPVLEKLTLQLYCEGPNSEVKMIGSPDPTKRTTVISDHLKIVEVKCEEFDDTVLNVLKFLSKLQIHFKDMEDLVSEEDGPSTS